MTQTDSSLKHHGLFFLLVALWIVLGASIVVYDSGIQYGSEHRRFEKMDQGGSGQLRHWPILRLGWLFGVLEIATFVTVLSLGLRRRNNARLVWLLTIGGAIYIGVMTALFLAYRDYLTAADPPFIGPFPAPTAVLIFGVWSAPVFFVVLYVVLFNRAIVTDEDLKRFKQLLAARGKKDEGT